MKIIPKEKIWIDFRIFEQIAVKSIFVHNLILSWLALCNLLLKMLKGSDRPKYNTNKTKPGMASLTGSEASTSLASQSA